MPKKMTPEQLIERIKGKKLKITPIVEIVGKGGPTRVACDCSGCNNPKIAIDVFRREPSDPAEGAFEGGKVRGYLVLEEAAASKKPALKTAASRKARKRTR